MTTNITGSLVPRGDGQKSQQKIVEIPPDPAYAETRRDLLRFRPIFTEEKSCPN